MRQMLPRENINCCQVIVVCLQQFFKNTQEGLLFKVKSVSTITMDLRHQFKYHLYFLHLMVYSGIIRCTQRQAKMPSFSQLPQV